MHITSSLHTQLVVLPPAKASISSSFTRHEINSQKYDRLLSEMQRLRGSVYLHDGGIQANELTRDGLHKLAIDELSWHMLLLDDAGHVRGCMRYLEEKKASRFE